MRRKSMLSRKVWYIRRRNLRTINLCLRIFPLLAVLVALLSVVCGRLAPAFREEAGRRAAAEMRTVIEKTVTEALQNSDFESVFNTSSISTESTDGAGPMNETLDSLAVYLSEYLSDRLGNPESIVIGLPLGNISGSGLLYGQGPLIKTRIYCTANAEATCSLPGEQNGTAASPNRVVVQIRAAITYHSLFVNGNTLVTAEIPAATVRKENQAFVFSFAP